MKTPNSRIVVGRLSTRTPAIQNLPRNSTLAERMKGITYYHSSACPIHHCKLAETAMGNKWCPECEGERMAKEVARKCKLNLRPSSPKTETPFELYQVSSAYPKVTVDQFYKWYSNPKHQYHCVFCSEHFEGERPDFCPRCKEYKGIEPCLSSGPNNNCQLDAGWKPE